MRARLGHASVLQHQDLVAVVDRPQPVRHEHARARLLLQDAVDVLQQRLLRVRVKGRSLVSVSAI